MTNIERKPQQLLLRAGSTTVALDKSTAKAELHRKFLIWGRRPLERPLAEIEGVTMHSNVDRASGVEVCSTVLIMRDHSRWAIPSADRKDAEATVAAVRDFLGRA